MHEKCFKIDFFAIFRKLQKKLPICKKRYAEILHNGGAVVTNVEIKSNRHNRIFFGSAKVAPGCRHFLFDLKLHKKHNKSPNKHTTAILRSSVVQTDPKKVSFLGFWNSSRIELSANQTMRAETTTTFKSKLLFCKLRLDFSYLI